MRLAEVRYDAGERLVVAHVSGEIDMSNSNDIAAAIARSTPNAALGVIVDLDEVEYLDSAGIHLIYRLRSSLSTRGQRLVLVIGPQSVVHDVLRLAGVTELVDVHDTVGSAVDALDPSEKEPTSA